MSDIFKKWRGVLSRKAETSVVTGIQFQINMNAILRGLEFILQEVWSQ